ncbi:MAG TPA: DUF1294 domain-containing protein [Thermomicrobiales bacterium]|jgi:uncharacterized membrane protein YsdA (DUF1294 family)
MATNSLHERPPVARPQHHSPKKHAAIAAAILWGGLLLALFIVFDWSLYLNWILAGTVATFFFYAYDKWQARRGGWRIPEIVLKGLVLAGGVIGGWIGMLGLRHKTLHRAFWVVQWVATALWLVLAWFFWLR